MRHTFKARRLPRFFLLTVFTLTFGPTTAPLARAQCEFVEVRKAIDNVLLEDAEKSASFKKEMAAGADSLYVMEKLVPVAMREKLDACRFEAGEYLTKRGYPPAH